MNYITRNKGVLISLLLDTLDRKPITNETDRNNFRDLILDYCGFLHALSFLEISELNLRLSKQRVFLNKLDTLTQRYKSIGIDCIPDKSVEDFLTNIQEHMKDWIDNDLNIELWKEELKHYSNASSKLEMSTTTALERRKSEAVDVLMNSARTRVNF